MDYTAYPHILDAVLAHSDWQTLQAMRLTSKTLNDKVCKLIYRHVVIKDDWHPAQLVVREAYFHRPLFALDRDSGSVRPSPRYQGEDIGPRVSAEDGLERLRKYTRIYTGDWEHSRGLAWNAIQPALAHAEVVREQLSAVVPKPLPYRQATVFLSLNTREPLPGSVHGRHFVFTHGLQPPGQMVVVVSNRQDRRRFGHQHPCCPKLEALCHTMDGLMGGFSISITSVVLIRNDSSLPPAPYWDTFITQVQSTGNARINSGDVPNATPITFLHTTPDEYQAATGMSDSELHMLLTLPNVKMPVPPVWAVPGGYTRPLDPYHHKPLIILDRKVPASQRLHVAEDDERNTPSATPVWKQALERLIKHTRILDFQQVTPSSDRSYLAHWRTALEPLVAKVNIRREVSVGSPFASLPPHAQHQQSLMLYIRTGDLTTGEFATSHYTTTRLVTRGPCKTHAREKPSRLGGAAGLDGRRRVAVVTGAVGVLGRSANAAGAAARGRGLMVLARAVALHLLPAAPVAAPALDVLPALVVLIVGSGGVQV
ncbi:uncharacterized protein LOC62_07G008952 [Vanrija pseudolonga]|uniref:Uncharacterized protein n=1 Tax=Vanrija pseudolonga TaxID=143232 RepID=A0AAF1BU08_9TREE|nr:hypothetical protein LOC62_07G008952 [Vanrija pseudolonga]